MNLADALRRVNSETGVQSPSEFKPQQVPQPEAKEPAVDPRATQLPAETSPHVSSGNVVRLELFLSAEQMGGLFRAIMAGQHTILTLREAASFLRIGQEALVKMAEDGEIPGILMEGRWRFPKNNLDEWLIAHCHHTEESGNVA